ncbi:MAG: 5'-methylthioadenosine/S-adenosylhomocysteine nucleosidase family protein [Actinomycetota bacterium]
MPRTIIALVVSLVALQAPLASHAQDRCQTKRILVLSAFPGEIDPLISKLQNPIAVLSQGRTFYQGELEGQDVALGLTGIGLANATNTVSIALNSAFKCDGLTTISSIVFSGVSGGQNYIGDVAVPARWTLDGQTWYPTSQAMLNVAQLSSKSVVLSQTVPLGDPACAGIDPTLIQTIQLAHVPQVFIGGDGFSSDPFGGRRLPCFAGDVFGCEPCRAPSHSVPDAMTFANDAIPFIDPSFFIGYFNQPTVSGYDAQDMETAAVAKVASDNNIPFIAFRAQSDGKGDPLMLPGFPFQFFVYRQYAAENAGAEALAFLQKWGRP